MPVVLSITPTQFIASNGDLDSDNRYIFKVASNESFLFPEGRTIDLPYQGIVYKIDIYAKHTGTSSTFSANYHKMRL
mgnify:CR=1 FL=1|jgi:hypothetical protein